MSGALPIEAVLGEVLAALRDSSRLVLGAPPGAGKTTRVPAALLDAGLAGPGEVWVLEPRRIAARAAAEYVAAERGGGVGDEVGYRVRLEERGGTGTRLWFMTEGILTRRLARDPFLERAGIVVLDEFHERHLAGDLALGIVRELQETVRADLKLVVMSATLDTESLAAFLEPCTVVTSSGRSYPVEVHHDARPSDGRLSERVRAALVRALGEEDDGGDFLVFLPGAGEIRRAAEAITELTGDRGLDVVVLHGDLPLEGQRRALSRGRRRRVVLSTNVAETALTVEGVTTVIDSGLAREARLDRRHGINHLRVVRVSRASAAQRAGRAGRTAPGRCFRLWTEADHRDRRERESPEVARLDLTATILELRAWGCRDFHAFRWLDPPSPAAVDAAVRLLELLGALSPEKRALTEIGRRMLEMSVAPRLARMLVECERRGHAAAGALLAALASERDICAERRAFGGGRAGRWPDGPSDLLLRRELFAEARAAGFSRSACEALGLDARAVQAVERARRQLSRAARGGGSGDGETEALLRATLTGFPDRVARRREPGSPRGRMVGGGGVQLDPSSVVRSDELFVAVDVEAGTGGGTRAVEARVRVASRIRREWLEETFPGSVAPTTELIFDDQSQSVLERLRESYGDLVLSERTRAPADREAAADMLADEVLRDPERALQLGDRERQLLERIRFLARALPEAGVSDVDDVLGRAVRSLAVGRTSFAAIRTAEFEPPVRSVLGGAAPLLDREAPAVFRLPSGRIAAVRYEAGKPPAFDARIQEVFGLAATPRVARGRVSAVIRLLAPSGRPVQVTDDLASFWSRTYAEVRKQLRGRYPKHAWPEDPTSATPSSRPRRR
ncbi:MAG: ATP-dependent helicase HrpB [Candidatus Binatota bacterium]|nr:ATP-dependent helicase HrpB [Candidatus Binatota bacterium]